MAELVAELSESSLDALQRRVEELARGLGDAASLGAVEAAEMAADAARDACPSGTGSLAASIRVEPRDGGADVVCSAPYAAFVEFGTGLGPASGAPDDVSAMGASGYEVNASGRGEEGWVYPTEEGGFRLTHGQPGSGFMAAGAEAARAAGVEAVLTHVSDYLRGAGA